MKLSDFDYELPAERIAQAPLPIRDHSRLLVLNRAASGATSHHRFHELPTLLRRGDLLILNDTRVLPARLLGRKSSGGRVELLLLEPETTSSRSCTWRCLIQSSRTPRHGSGLELEGGLRAEVVERRADWWSVRFDASGTSLLETVERVGRMPLPPYIRREPPGEPVDDRTRYQTVFAEHSGAVAAPTAGLHFTPALLGSLEGAGIEVSRLTLHVGVGTFLPVRVERVEDHPMHDERFVLPSETAAAIEGARGRGGRVVAVGTTVVRVLEDRAAGGGRVTQGTGRCGLFILPGFRFGVVDAVITNFHLPCSTLLMLVSAFAGRERVLAAYREAIAEGYRFYSYGDAMLLE